MLTTLVEPNNLRSFFGAFTFLRSIVRGARDDGAFVRRIRTALLPTRFDGEPAPPADVFPPAEPFAAPALQGKRVAIVVSAGSGATTSCVGVQRAFEEAGLQPAAISASSGATLFASLWACGLDAGQVARFWLTLPRSGYVDPDWPALLRAAGHGLRGWAGLLRGDALEKSFRDLLGDRRLGETKIPFSTVAWNIDLNRIEVLGSRATPDLPVALAARMAIAIPVFVEPVRIGGHLYGDGGVIDAFPVRPVLDERPDVIFGLNCYLPRGFAGEDVSGWRDRTLAIFNASGQLRWSGMLALAREQALLAGDRLSLLHPVPWSEVRGSKFYDTFLERTRWPEFMLAGRKAAREALLAAGPAAVAA